MVVGPSSEAPDCITPYGGEPGTVDEAGDWRAFPAFAIIGLCLCGLTWWIFHLPVLSVVALTAPMLLFIVTVNDDFCVLTVCVNSSGLTTRCGDTRQTIPFSQIRSVTTEWNMYLPSDFVIRGDGFELRIPDSDDEMAAFFLRFGVLLREARGMNFYTSSGARRRMGWPNHP